MFFPVAVSVLLAATVPGGAIYEATGGPAYFPGKTGFRDVVHAKNHAFKEFHAEVRRGRLHPARGEYFCYLYTLDPGEGRPLVFFHSQWEPAEYVHTAAGSHIHEVRSPLAETGRLRIYSMMHTHPAGSRHGDGPSRVDVATASKYKNPDGSYRYLYLINSHGKLIQFKARRDLDPRDPSALASMPHQPRMMLDWLD